MPLSRVLIGPTAASTAVTTSSRSTNSVTAAIPAAGVNDRSAAPTRTRATRGRRARILATW
jgi:hypothetical protein